MKINLTDKQNEFIRNAHARWNFKVGAVRSGKSFVDIAYTIGSRIRERAGLPGLTIIMGVSKGTIERNVLQPMREIYTDALIGTINNENVAIVFGEPCYCLGAEKVSQVSKILGASVKYCYGDEVAKWSPQVFEVLKSRLDKEYSCFDGACNPESPNHWLKAFIDDPELDAYIQKYVIFDNPHLPKKYVKNLCNEYAGTVYYDRYILGEWALAEGLIYPMYQSAIVEGLPMDSKGEEVVAEQYVVSIDYGTMNAFAAILWSKRGGVWYAEKEYYYSGRDTGIQKTDQEYADDLDVWIKTTWEALKGSPGCDYYGEAYAKIKCIIDPSAASFIALLKKRDWCKVIPADNDVLDGIRESAVAMQVGKIRILRSLENWKAEAGGYIWDENSGEERPVKVADHCLTGDTLVMTEFGAKPIEELVGTSGNVWSYNVETGCAELKPYHDCRLTQEMADIYEIETDDGRVVRCTGEHPVLTQRGFVLTKYLKPSDKIIDIKDAISCDIDKP